MKKHLFLLCALLMAVAVGCSRGSTYALDEPENPNEIVIRPSEGVLSPGHGDLRVGFARVDEDVNDYTTANILFATWKGALSATAGTVVQFDQNQYYLPNGGETTLIGFYPADTLVKYNAGTLTIPFDAHTDILLSDPVSASRTAKFGTGGKNFVFKHKLACLKFNIYISTADAAKGWGTIKDIAIIGQADTCFVELPSTVTFSQPNDTLYIARRDYDTNNPITYPFVLPTDVGKDHAVLCGYAMIAPFAMPNNPTTADRLQIIITHEVNGNVGKVKTGLAFPVHPTTSQQTGWEAGNVYDVNLGLSATEIEITATISEWLDGGTVDVPL